MKIYGLENVMISKLAWLLICHSDLGQAPKWNMDMIKYETYNNTPI